MRDLKTLPALMARLLVLTGVLFCSPIVAAHEYQAGDLKIHHPWSRVTPDGARAAGGFMTITNTGTVSDKLVGGTFVLSDKFEVHEMSMTDGVMKMRQLENGLEIKPGQTVELKPGSFHVMMIGLKQPMKDGDKIKGTLVFERAGTIDVDYKIEPIGTRSSAGPHHDHTVHSPEPKKAH
jgi:periplasmic copper chaperone A